MGQHRALDRGFRPGDGSGLLSRLVRGHDNLVMLAGAPARRWCTCWTEVEVTPYPGNANAMRSCAGDARIPGAPPTAFGSGPLRRWLPQSAGRRSRVLATEVRSVPCIGPLSFRPASVGHNLLLSARPTVLAPGSS